MIYVKFLSASDKKGRLRCLAQVLFYCIQHSYITNILHPVSVVSSSILPSHSILYVVPPSQVHNSSINTSLTPSISVHSSVFNIQYLHIMYDPAYIHYSYTHIHTLLIYNKHILCDNLFKHGHVTDTLHDNGRIICKTIQLADKVRKKCHISA